MTQTKEDHLRSLRKAQEEASGGYATDLASAQARLQEAELKCRGVEASLKQALHRVSSGINRVCSLIIVRISSIYIFMILCI